MKSHIKIWAGEECRVRWSNLLFASSCLSSLVRILQITIQNKEHSENLVTQSPRELDFREIKVKQLKTFLLL